MARCELTDLPVDGCAHCRGITEVAPLPPKWSQPRTWVTAAYSGRCSSCDGDIVAEVDRITYDGHGGWLGECCGDDDHD